MSMHTKLRACLLALLVLVSIAGCKPDASERTLIQRDQSVPQVSFGDNAAAAVLTEDWPKPLVAPAVRELPSVSPAAPLAGRPGGPVVLLGIDGADWQVLGPLLAQGRLPNLARLLAAGAYGSLETDVGFSPISWSSIACGALSSAHGVGDRTALDPQISCRLKAIPVWEVALERGLSVGVVQAYFGEGLPTERGSFYGRLRWPENEIELTGLTVDAPALSRYPAAWRELNRSDVKAWLAVEHTPDLFFTIIDTLDAACHYNLHGLAALRPGGEPAAKQAALLRSMWQRIVDAAAGIDQVIGRVWDNLPAEATLLLVSDHGQGFLDLEYTIKPSWALEQALGCERIQPGAQSCSSSIGLIEVEYQIEDLRLPWLSIRGVEFSMVIHSGRIAIRPAAGTDPARFAEWAATLAARLPAEGPESMRPVVELRGGKLWIRPADPTAAVLQAAPHEEMPCWERTPRFLANHGQGNPGIILVAGPGIAPGRAIEGARLQDVAPTMLYALGLAPADSMSGRVLTALYRQDYLERHPPRTPRGYARVKCTAPLGLDPDTLQRLKSLGYLN